MRNQSVGIEKNFVDSNGRFVDIGREVVGKFLVVDMT